MRVHIALDGVLIDEMGSIALKIEMTKWYMLIIITTLKVLGHLH